MLNEIHIRQLQCTDEDAVWAIFHVVLKMGDTHALAPETTRAEGLDFWFSKQVTAYVACNNDNDIMGVYRILPNVTGLGNHVANGGYIVDPKYRGQGVARMMAEHSFVEAKRMKFVAMQYNFVVSTNLCAVHLWKKVGFNIIGISPGAFRHPQHGLVDTYMMHKVL